MTIAYPPSFEQLKIHCSPNIPEKKINNALKHYVPHHIALTDIILLVDDTVFGSGKSGFLLTFDNFYYKKDFVEPILGEIQGITNITFKKGIITHSLCIEYNKQPDYWVLEFTQCSSKDISVFAGYLLQAIRQLQKRVETETLSESITSEPESIASESDTKFEIEYQTPPAQLNESISLVTEQPETKIQNSPLKSEVKIAEARNNTIKLNSKQTPRYFGTMIDPNQSEPEYFGRLVVPQEEVIQPASSEGNSLLTKFLQNNADGIVAKLKTSGLALTSAALQNDDNIIRIAGIIYNILPTPIRFVVSLNTLEDLLLKNRHWLINKLQ